MPRRGATLRDHILWTAKDVFLELGFERASMDIVAGRAETSKRSLYAHFESKEKLFLAVIELVRELFLNRLRKPGDYADKPADALVLFCGCYLQTLTYKATVQMCRVTLAETERFPDGASQYFDVLFAEAEARLRVYLGTIFGLSARASAEAARRLLGQVLYPRFPQALFGMATLAESLDHDALARDFDLQSIRKAVDTLLASLAEPDKRAD